MKKRLLVITLLLGSAIPVWSQNTNTGPSVICGIYYDYDAAGNRIRRMYDCREMEEPIGDEPQSFALNGMGKSAPPKSQKPGTDAGLGYISLFPNPTAGSYTVKLSKAPEKPMHFHWYTDQMQILSSGTISSETFTGDISSWADGVYILRVYSATEQHSFKVVKVTASPQ